MAAPLRLPDPPGRDGGQRGLLGGRDGQGGAVHRLVLPLLLVVVVVGQVVLSLLEEISRPRALGVSEQALARAAVFGAFFEKAAIVR